MASTDTGVVDPHEEGWFLLKLVEYFNHNAGLNERVMISDSLSSDLLHATSRLFPSMDGVTFSTDRDPIRGSVQILVDPVTRRYGQKPASGGCDSVDANGNPWMKRQRHIEKWRMDNLRWDRSNLCRLNQHISGKLNNLRFRHWYSGSDNRWSSSTMRNLKSLGPRSETKKYRLPDILNYWSTGRNPSMIEVIHGK